MRTRKALSTVIGAVFAIIALTSTVTYISYSMGILDNYNQSVLTKNQQLSDINTEKFQISSVTVPNSKLNITVSNTGNLPIKFTKIWVQNTTTAATSTSWINSYVPTNNFVAPGGTLTKIGQDIPVSINSANSYNIKLVTSRGNTQQFTIGSANSLPLNVQFYSFPATVPSDFTTELVLIVTNNQTSTLTNLVPQISKWTSNPLPSTAVCNPSVTSSPPSASTLAPGSTAVFKWDLRITGKDGQTCIYYPSLNGFSYNTVLATASVNAITATSSNWSTTWGILSINYTTLQWATDGGSSWNNAWSVPANHNLVWRVNISNNDLTRAFIINGNTTLVAFGTSPGSNAATQFYIIKNTYPPIAIYPTNTQIIAANSTSTVYFGATSAADTGPVSFSQGAGKTLQYAVSIILFGYWNSVATTNFFGQNIPYEGIIVFS
jgi:hypothetical protein